MKLIIIHIILLFLSLSNYSCFEYSNKSNKGVDRTAKEILGDSSYQAISYGGYRQKSRDVQPTLEEVKEDMKILSAMGIKLVRTYNVQYEEVSTVLKAISDLKNEDPTFEMYLMIGAWIDCKDAWSANPIPDLESPQNASEIERAIKLIKQYPDIIKMISVGNESMVKWAASYYVEAEVILKWVKYLQDLKQNGSLPKDLWITSSDNFASWGGGGSEYHVEALNQLIKEVDFISMHTYPMLDTHYNPEFWGVGKAEENLSDIEKINAVMLRARDYAISQYEGVESYLNKINIKKPIHIGETGWSTLSNEFYGNDGSRATDEYKSALFHAMIREWTNSFGITCFYFEAFDEQWKDSLNPEGSENHFGFINLQSQAKYAIWGLVDTGVFSGLNRNGKPITKTYEGDEEALLAAIRIPLFNSNIK